MTKFIDLERRFHDLTTEELGDQDVLAALGDTTFGLSSTWPKILESRRVVILAEAGSGKTCKMEQQQHRLNAAGWQAFFVPLERLGSERLTDILGRDERARLNSWLQETGSPAWFFLDAADELKLINGKLDIALSRLANDLEGHLERSM